MVLVSVLVSDLVLGQVSVEKTIVENRSATNRTNATTRQFVASDEELN